MSAEEALLSSVLLDPSLLDDIVPVVTAEDFVSEFNASVYDTILALQAKGDAIDLVTVKDRMPSDAQTRSRLLDIGGAAANTANALTYARRVSEAGRHRRLSRSLAEATMTDNLDMMMSAALAALDAAEGKGSAGVRRISSVLAERYTTLTEKRDYIWLADFPGPHLHLGSLVYLAARPGVGKSALALQLALEWSARHLPVRVYDYEMGEESWADRVIQAKTEFTTEHLDEGLTAEQVYEVRQMTSGVSDLLTIVDAPKNRMTIDGLIADIRKFARGGGKVAIIDYLQLAVPQEYDTVTEASRRLKLVAKECDILVVALSQLKRRMDEAGNPKPPTMSDLRQSGALEQDADVVILLHQYPEEQTETIMRSLAASKYHVGDPIHAGKKLARVDFAKMRRGRTYRFPAYYCGEGLCFTTIDRTL